MEARIEGRPAFAHIHLTLEPGESLIAESDAMATMSADLDMDAKLSGGLVSAVARRVFAGESLFVNTFANRTQRPLQMTLVQSTPGDICRLDLTGGSVCLQPGAYIASTPGLDLGVRYAGMGSFIGREGLFKLQVSGTGSLWYGAYGGLVEKHIDGEYIVDSGHLVAYGPEMKLRVQLAGGVFSSLFGGEGLVTRVEGRGPITLQTRSLSGLASWLNPRL
jgi:uncharacterized protein (TIGR00266 family)